MALHALQMSDQRGSEAIAVGKAHHRADPRHAGIRLGQFMRLLIGHHLDPMLDVAQEQIGRAQIVAHIRRDPAMDDERVEIGQRLPTAQGRVAATGDR